MADPTGYQTGVGEVSYPIKSPDFDSEFGWGEGLVPKGLEDAPPNMGGRYRGTIASETQDPRPKINVDNDLRI